uniref:Ubiquitin-like domain-containing protein n=1 Tax=Nelumbo nucifera TaxID=4432 RepID=A0A822YDP9_NELNU|nr:TPA_asm: hypothetical protein HUJ06_009333 [Nelumbo nucifera]
MPEEDLVELKFRLYDGSDIGPIRYSSTSTVAMLKERIVAEWPRDKKVVPKAASDVKLISAGKILENNKTVGQCRVPFGELPGGVITMHVVVQPSLAKTKTEKRLMIPPGKVFAPAPYCKGKRKCDTHWQKLRGSASVTCFPERMECKLLETHPSYQGYQRLPCCVLC